MFESSGEFKDLGEKGTRMLLEYQCPMLISRYWKEKQKEGNNNRRFTVVCLDPDSLSTSNNNSGFRLDKKHTIGGYIDVNSSFMSVPYEKVCRLWLQNYTPGKFI